jgi:hypothetical protein
VRYDTDNYYAGSGSIDFIDWPAGGEVDKIIFKVSGTSSTYCIGGETGLYLGNDPLFPGSSARSWSFSCLKNRY